MTETPGSLSPIRSLVCGHLFLLVMIVCFYLFGFYANSTYFAWGPPVTIFSYELRSNKFFYLMWSLIFIHQLINNWIYEVVVPWIINTVQNPRQSELQYSPATCLLIINANSLYNQIHLALIITGIMSQISFLLALCLADFCTLTYINWQYLKSKNVREIELETA